jgi:hypothetical protein
MKACTLMALVFHDQAEENKVFLQLVKKIYSIACGLRATEFSLMVRYRIHNGSPPNPI